MKTSALIGLSRHRIGVDGTGITTLVAFHVCPPPDDIPQKIIMRIDRPFGFAIREYDQLLFLGVVKDMNKKPQ